MPDIDAGQLRKAVEGDSKALAGLLRQHGPVVERTLRIEKTWQRHIDTADVMQVTFIEVFRRIRDFDLGRPDRFESWLRQIAENNLRDAIRGLTRQKRGGDGVRKESPQGPDELADMIASPDSTPTRVVRRAERGSGLKRALAQLPPDYAEVVRRLDLEGQPVGEAAAEMGRSAGAVHMLRARAHERLKDLLGPASAYITRA